MKRPPLRGSILRAWFEWAVVWCRLRRTIAEETRISQFLDWLVVKLP